MLGICMSHVYATTEYIIVTPVNSKKKNSAVLLVLGCRPFSPPLFRPALPFPRLGPRRGGRRFALGTPAPRATLGLARPAAARPSRPRPGSASPSHFLCPVGPPVRPPVSLSPTCSHPVALRCPSLSLPLSGPKCPASESAP